MRHQRPRILRVLRVRSRRFATWIDRRAAVWLAWVPSWGTSLLIHSLVILLFGLYFYARSGRTTGPEVFETTLPSQLTEDVVSLTPADRSGDPFTKEKSAEPPSVSVEAPDPELKLASQPAIPRLTSVAPIVAGPSPLEQPATGPKGKGTRLFVPTTHAEDVSAPFSGRQTETRAAMVRRGGGTVRSEKAVEDGIQWLVRHQRDDGGWSLNYQGQCQEGVGCRVDQAMESDTGATGLALLPLLGAGHIHTAKSRYQTNVRQALDWLVEHQNPAGDLFIGGGRTVHLYSHAIATMALCEAYGLSKDERLRGPAQKALSFVIDSQNTANGGWRYEAGQPGDTSVFGWHMFALRSARLAGLNVPKNVLKGCKSYLDEAASDSRKATYSYMPGHPVSPIMTAEALLSRQYLGWPRDFPPLLKGAAHVAADLKTSEDRNIYYWYYATQLLHNMQGKEWEGWNQKVREGLIRLQVGGIGCDRGSWDPALPQPDRWGSAGGRLYVTSLSVLTLEVYYRYLPLYRPSDTDPPAPDLAAGKVAQAPANGRKVPEAK